MGKAEQWKDVVGYEGTYQVSNLGRVRSIDRVVRHSRGGPRRMKGKILQPIPSDNCGHLVVTLYKKVDGVLGRRNVFIHKLVALTFLGPRPPGQIIRHGVNGVTDNSTSNLSYGTHQQDGLDKRLTGTHGGRPVKRSDGVVFINMAVAAEETPCNHSSIWAVCNKRRRKTANGYRRHTTAGGYGWEYLEE